MTYYPLQRPREAHCTTPEDPRSIGIRTSPAATWLACCALGFSLVGCGNSPREYGNVNPPQPDSAVSSVTSTSRSPECQTGVLGAAGCGCFPNGTCFPGLTCVAYTVCQVLADASPASSAETNGAASQGSSSSLPSGPGTASVADADVTAGPSEAPDASVFDAASASSVVPPDSGATPDPTTNTPPTSTAAPTPREPLLVTSGEGTYWQVSAATEGSDTPTVTVDESQEYQVWSGFGGAFSERGWQALSALGPADKDRALELLFDKQAGAGLTYGRIPVGSNEYALDRYSLNETDGDYDMTEFSIERDQQALIPYIQAALAVNPDIQFWAVPWSPPTWMKDNNTYDRGNMKNDAQTLAAHALYLARFVEEYEAEGIDIAAVAPQNEAGYAQDYPSCAWTPAQMTDYIRTYLGPSFARLSTEADIWLGTLSNETVDGAIGQAVLADTTAASFIEASALQWGFETKVGEYAESGKLVIQSDHKPGNFPWLTESYRADKAPNDHAYAIESWGSLKSWITKGVHAYSVSNLILDTVGQSLDIVRTWNQNALLVVNTGAGTLTVTPAYYVLRHLAQYVEPAAVRLATSGGDALAFKNPDGSIVTVLYNASAQAAATTLAVAGKSLAFDIPARGWATAVSWQ